MQTGTTYDVHLLASSLIIPPQVCSIFLSIVDNNVSIQYKVELLAANLVDGDPVAIPQDPAGRLALLKAHQEAWRPLHWTIETPLSMEGPAWELIGGVLGVSPSPDVLQITQLPSKYRRIPYKQWTLSNKGFEVEDFSMDPSQDLLVVVQRQDSRCVFVDVKTCKIFKAVFE